MTQLHSASVIFLAFLFSLSIHSQKIDSEEKKAVILGVKELLLSRYIDSTKAISVSKKIKVSGYKKKGTRKNFLDRLNKELYKITNDKHLYVEFNPKLVEEMKSDSPKSSQNEEEKRKNFGFSKLEILTGNIGYLKLDFFANDEEAGYLLDPVFQFFKNTNGLIIDLRKNLGGNIKMLEHLLSYFLDQDLILLNIKYSSGRLGRIQIRDKKPKLFYDQKVILLCSSETFSAGEAFAFILKNFDRALLIGEQTAGAGNIAGPYVIVDNYVITITTGEILDPVNNKGWEGTGVTCDIEINSNKVFEKAIEKMK